MTITEQLEELSQVKSDIADAITEKGVDTTAADAFGGFAEKIKAIESGGVEYTLLTQTISASAYTSANITLPFTPWVLIIYGDRSSGAVNLIRGCLYYPDYLSTIVIVEAKSSSDSLKLSYNSSASGSIIYVNDDIVTFKGTQTLFWTGTYTILAIKKPN